MNTILRNKGHPTKSEEVARQAGGGRQTQVEFMGFKSSAVYDGQVVKRKQEPKRVVERNQKEARGIVDSRERGVEVKVEKEKRKER